MKYGNLNVLGAAKYGDFITHYEKNDDTFTKLLIHGGGVDGSTTFIDNAGGKTITAGGTAQVDTAQSVFGQGRILFDGNSDSLSMAASTDFQFGTGDFTIDLRVRFNVVPNTNGKAAVLFRQYQVGTAYFWFYVYNDGTINFSVYDSSTGTSRWKGYNWSPNTNQWYHIALVRSNISDYYLFIDGVAQTVSGSSGTLNQFPYVNSTAYIGWADQFDSPANHYLDGWIEEFRISKTARWTSNFTPPTLPYEDANPVDSYTKLLLHCDGINNSTTFYDNESTPKAVTAVGTAKCDTAQKVFGTSSVYLDGNSDALTVPDSADYHFGSVDFTLDFRARFEHINASQALIGQWGSGGSTWLFYWYKSGATQQLVLIFLTDGAPYNTEWVARDWTPTLNQWYHLAAVRSGNTIKLFVDGTQLGSTYNMIGTNVPNPGGTPTLQIGYINTTGDYFQGWIDEIRITKGLARWTANFTPYSNAYVSHLTQIPIVNLDGDVDEEYRLITRYIGGSNNNTLGIRLNNDSGNNCGYQAMYGSGTTLAALRDTSETYMNIGAGGLSINELTMTDTLLSVKSGYGRTGVTTSADRINYSGGTSVGYLYQYTNVWNNTVDNVTSLVAMVNVENGIGFGSYVLLKKKIAQVSSGFRVGNISQPKEKLLANCFETVFETTLGAPATYIDIPNLDGDRDILYRVVMTMVWAVNDTYAWVVPNDDTDNNNYGKQSIVSYGSSQQAHRATGGSWSSWMGFKIGYCYLTPSVSYGEILFYAKSGNIRTSLLSSSDDVNGYTPNAPYMLQSAGGVWNNSVNKITSLRVRAYQSTGSVTNGFGTGTYLRCEALKHSIRS